MTEIPDSLCSLFSAPIEEREGSYIVEIPDTEIDHEVLAPNQIYRVALLETADSTASDGGSLQSGEPQTAQQTQPPKPPVEEGEIRSVTIESVGDEGDGIAKVERGYVVIVPDGQPPHEVTVEIERVRESVAFASIVESTS